MREAKRRLIEMGLARPRVLASVLVQRASMAPPREWSRRPIIIDLDGTLVAIDREFIDEILGEISSRARDANAQKGET